jgi:hypothetical protein
MLNNVRRFIHTQYWEILYVEHYRKIYLSKILGNTLCWALLEDLFTQNTEKYLMLSTDEDLFIHNTGKYFLLITVGKFIYTKYWEILSIEHYRKIYLHKILGNTLCWTLLEDLLTQNTGKYFMLITVGRFIYTTNREIRDVEHWE